MTAYNPVWLPVNADLSATASYDIGVAIGSWGAGSTLTFSSGTAPTFTNPNAFTGVTFASVKLQKGFRGSFGDESNYIALRIDNASSSLFDGNHKGPAFIKGVTSQAIARLWWRPDTNDKLLATDLAVSPGETWIGSGSAKFGSTVTVGDVVVSGSGQCQILEHASDETGDIRLTGRATMLLKRPMGSGKKAYVNVGTTLTIDLTATTGAVIAAGNVQGEVVLCGGTLILINGNVTVDGQSGKFDRTRLERAAAVTISGYPTPDLMEYEGNTLATVTRTTPLGAGPQIVRQP